jgi:hypothetical protein
LVISNTALRSRSSSTSLPLTWNFSVVPRDLQRIL